jgi:propionate CoA-transferase
LILHNISLTFLYLQKVGLGTFVDPNCGTGGAINEAALRSSLQNELVTRLTVTFDVNQHSQHEYLLYKALPIQVAIIRATTADSMGNLSLEHESLLCDQRITAAAARNSGGIVLAQVKRLSSNHVMSTRSVHIPGAMVDCVVVVDESEHDYYHPMSYEKRLDPVLTNEIRAPSTDVNTIKLDKRKVIARRASFALKPGKIVNLGIGLPEGVASVAHEEGMLDYVTLTTEPGVFGGLPASGKNFGPSANADALIDMNEMFDYYDGGGLDLCFLGAGQISSKGDVNVSRISTNVFTGPGGFIDISQSTRNVCFLATFTTKGLELSFNGDGEISVKAEGTVNKFVSEVSEITFSGDEAVRRGQKVFYVTERAVFRRSLVHEVLELIEIAPGIRLKEDILDQMEFDPVISPNLKLMDSRIFKDKKMDIPMFGSLDERFVYNDNDHVIFINLFGINLSTEADIEWFFNGVEDVLKPFVQQKGPIDVVVNYDGFDVAATLLPMYGSKLSSLEEKYYKSVKRFAGKAFRRAGLAEKVHLKRWDQGLFDAFDKDGDGVISAQEIRDGMRLMFGISLTPFEINEVCNQEEEINRQNFATSIKKLLLRESLEY